MNPQFGPDPTLQVRKQRHKVQEESAYIQRHKTSAEVMEMNGGLGTGSSQALQDGGLGSCLTLSSAHLLCGTLGSPYSQLARLLKAELLMLTLLSTE